MKAWTLILVAIPAFAEITDNTTVRVDSRTGVSVKGQASFSVSGTVNQATQSNSPYLLVPNPNYRSNAPGSTPSSLTDSNTFFQGIGKDSAPQPERRHRRRPDTEASAESPSAPASGASASSTVDE